MGTFSEIKCEAINASMHCHLPVSKVPIGNREMGGAHGSARTSLCAVTVISVHLFIELISCSLRQVPLDRKMGDNCAPQFLQGVPLPVMDQVTMNQ